MADQQIDPPIDPLIDPSLIHNGVPQGLPTISPENLAKMQELLQRPALKKYVALVSNPQFTADLGSLIQHPDLKLCGQWELGWLVAMVLFRSWWNSKPKTWIKAFSTSLILFAVYWFVSGFLIPSYFLNPYYLRFITDIYRLLN